MFNGQIILVPAAELPSMCEDHWARTGEDIPWVKVAFRSMLSTIKVHTHHCQLLPHSLTETVIESLRLLFFLWVCSHIAVYAVGWKELLCKGKALGLLHLHYLPLYLWKWCLWKHKCFGLNILLQCSKNIWS